MMRENCLRSRLILVSAGTIAAIANPKAMTQRTIEIRSEIMLQRPIAAYPSDKILWLNIRSPLADHPIKLCRQLDELPPDWCLTLRFNDIRVKVPADKAWTLFDMAMACKIAGFISQDWDILLINCEAGVSRSSAVALAVAEHLGLPSPLDESRHSPNPVVLETLRTAFAAGVALDAIAEYENAGFGRDRVSKVFADADGDWMREF